MDNTTETSTRIREGAAGVGGYYYSTQPFLAWILNRYFYDDRHYVFVAPFFPYGLKNPVSSNPYELFGNLYKPWHARDQYDAYIGNPGDDQLGNKRLGLRKGVLALSKAELIDPEIAGRLKLVCERCSTDFFCPVVYRVPMATVRERSPQQVNSALAGSTEYLLTDLRSNEFDVLFFDYWDYPKLTDLFLGRDLAPYQVLEQLEASYV